jgi:hypothetical protein
MQNTATVKRLRADELPAGPDNSDTNTDTDFDNKSMGTSILAMYGSDSDEAPSD